MRQAHRGLWGKLESPFALPETSLCGPGPPSLAGVTAVGYSQLGRCVSAFPWMQQASMEKAKLRQCGAMGWSAQE